MNVPFGDLSRSRLKNDMRVIQEVVESSQFVRGSFVAQFEEAFAAEMGFSYGIGVNSGTDALIIAIIATMGRGIAPFDGEIITPPNSFIATAGAIMLAGYKPVFADIDSDTYLIDPKSISDNITPKTKAIIPVHLYGQACDMHRIYQIARKNNLFVIEDACQAHGVDIDVDSRGSAAACYSFYPSKNLGAYGDGGAIVTNFLEIKELAMAIRNHGGKDKNNSMMLGTNSRLDTIQAAILIGRLQRLGDWNAQRKCIAMFYRTHLMDIPQVQVYTPVRDHIYHLFVIEADRRDELHKFLLEEGIHTGIHCPKLIYQQPAFAKFSSECPIAESKTSVILSLPIFPGIRDDEIRYVCMKIKEFYGDKS
jgi:dTDP-4-amino-4,6-dideoxygalactose transaminase